MPKLLASASSAEVSSLRLESTSKIKSHMYVGSSRNCVHDKFMRSATRWFRNASMRSRNVEEEIASSGHCMSTNA